MFSMLHSHSAATALATFCAPAGSSFGTELFSTYPSTLPLMITEFGADAYDQTNGQEWATDEQTLGESISQVTESTRWVKSPSKLTERSIVVDFC